MGEGMNQGLSPLIFDLWTEPENPAVNEDFMVYARIVDPDGRSDLDANEDSNIDNFQLLFTADNLNAGQINKFPLLNPTLSEDSTQDINNLYSISCNVTDLGVNNYLNTVNMTLTVSDQEGKSYNKIDTFDILAYNPEAPIIKYANATPSVMWENDTFSVSAWVVDGQDNLKTSSILLNFSDPLHPGYVFNVMEGGILTPVLEVRLYQTGDNVYESPLIYAPFIDANIATVNMTLFAEDWDGFSTDEQVSIEVHRTGNPIIYWVQTHPSSIYSGDNFTVVAHIEDREHDIGKNGVVVDMSSMGIADITLSAIDDNGFIYSGNAQSPLGLSDGLVEMPVNATDNHGNYAELSGYLRIVSDVMDVEVAPFLMDMTAIVGTTDTDIVENASNFYIRAEVLDIDGDLDESTVTLQYHDNASKTTAATRFTFPAGNQMISMGNDLFRLPSSINLWRARPENFGTHTFNISASDLAGNHKTGTYYLSITEKSEATGPELKVVSLTVNSNRDVVRGDETVPISFQIVRGGAFDGNVKVNYRVRYEVNNNITRITNGTVNKLPAGTTPITIYWDSTNTIAGLHNISVEITKSTPIEQILGVDPPWDSDNYTETLTTVLPRILIVDDDPITSGSNHPDDAWKWIQGALFNIGFTRSSGTRASASTSDYELHIVGTRPNGPAASVLVKYDIVIWFTGTDESPLSDVDMGNLEQFMDGGGSFMLISSGSLNSADIRNWNYLHIDTSSPITFDQPTPPILYGPEGHAITNNTLYDVLHRTTSDCAEFYMPDSESTIMMKGDPNNNTQIVAHNWTDGDSKLVFLSFDFSEVRYTSSQADLFYNSIMWLGNIEGKTQRDIAITGLSVSPATPNYRDEVTITATVRNNGPVDETFIIDFGLDGDYKAITHIEELKIQTVGTEERAIDIPITWNANVYGEHTLDVLVESEGDSNEMNNVITTESGIDDFLYIKFRLMVVDDDYSANNNGTFNNVTSNITRSLDELEYNYTYHRVEAGEPGPSTDDLRLHNAVLWVLGDSGRAGTDTLLPEDVENLTTYMTDENGKVWLMGQDLLGGLTGFSDGATTDGTFIKDILHVDALYNDVGTPSPITGVSYNDITHGMKHLYDNSSLSSDRGDRIVIGEGAEPISWYDDEKTGYSGLMYSAGAAGGHRLVVMAWEPSFIRGLFDDPYGYDTSGGGTRAPTVILADDFDSSTDGWTEVEDILSQELNHGNSDDGCTEGYRDTGYGHLNNSGSLYTHISEDADWGTGNTGECSYGWRESFVVPSAGDYYISFWYDLFMDEGFEENEFAGVYCSIGTNTNNMNLLSPYTNSYSGGNMDSTEWQGIAFIDQADDDISFDPQTGWRKFAAVENLNADTYYIEIGLFCEESTTSSEDAELWIDEVRVLDASQYNVLFEDDFNANDDFSTWDAQVDDDRWTTRDDNDNDYGGHAIDYIPEGSHCANSRGSNNQGYYIYEDLGDISEYEKIEFSFFYQTQDLEESNYPQLNYNDGSGWTTLYTCRETWDGSTGVKNHADDSDQWSDTIFDWQYVVIELPSSASLNNFEFSFYRWDEGWDDDFFIDDFKVTGFLSVVLNTPDVDSVDVTPSPTNEFETATLSAHIQGTGTPIEPPTDAYYWIGAIGDDPGSGGGTHLTPGGGWVGDDDVWVSDNIDISGWGDGAYNFWVRAESSAGWGNALSDTLVVTSDSPATTLTTVVPTPANEIQYVDLTAHVEDQWSAIEEAEYWVVPGGDSGEGNNFPMFPSDGSFDSPDEDVNITIDISGWADGSYTFYVRAKDDKDHWRTNPGDSATLQINIDSPQTTNVQTTPEPAVEVATVNLTATVTDGYSNIMAAEWFSPDIAGFGDTGAGTNQPMTATVGGYNAQSEDVYATIDISALDPADGPFRVAVRAQDDKGNWNTDIPDWGDTDTFTTINVSKIGPVTSDIDMDPNPTLGDVTVDLTAVINDVSTGISNILEAEYFVDVLGAEGDGVNMSATDGSFNSPTEEVSAIIDIGPGGLDLLPGTTHNVWVRGRDISGEWGAPVLSILQVTKDDTIPPTTDLVKVTPNPTGGASNVTLTARVKDDLSGVTAAEYFIGPSAGEGGTGTLMSPTDGAFDEKEEFVETVIDVSTLPFGQYVVWVRGLDARGHWGLADSTTLVVSRPSIDESIAARSELVYQVLRFFDHPDTRNELRVSAIDLNLTSGIVGQTVRPMVGESYLVSCEVYNIGHGNVTASVKFKDGDNIIHTTTVFVPVDEHTTVEAIWTPTLVGTRRLAVEIKPLTEEIFVFNNLAYKDVYVYFFYDDMEYDTNKWEHEATLVRINGESKLDFMDPPVDSEVVSTWSEMHGFEQTSETYYSFNTSFWCEEIGAAVRPPVDVVFALDTSGSMSEEMGDLRAGVCQFLSFLGPNDRVAVYTFDGGGSENCGARFRYPHDDGDWNPATGLSYLYMTQANKSDLMDDINGTGTGGHTCFYDTLGAAIDHAETYADGAVADSNRYEFVIGFTDGFSNSDDIYTPEYDWGTTGAGQTRYSTGAPHPTNGLLNAPVNVYTIGLNTDGGIDHDPNYPTNDGQHNPSPDEGSYKQEYDLWHCADSSTYWAVNSTTLVPFYGEYYYVTDPNALGNIFGEIFTTIASVSGIVTRGEDMGTRATTEKYMITDTFSLEDASSAGLTFRHKYKLQLGYNGGVIMVGTSPDGNSWSYKYVKPTKPYTQNLYIEETERDSDNNVMRWCWNGISADGTFGWESATFDLSDYIGYEYVRVRFQYFEYNGGSGGGWWVDDVLVKASRPDNTSVTNESNDQWEITDTDAYSGTQCWYNVNPSTGYFKGGIDNSLMTQTIDLTSAAQVTLSAMMKFNFNESLKGARPPDGFRVEVKIAGEDEWQSVTQGVRSAWGLSGSGNDLDDNESDYKAYTGLELNSNKEGWVEAGSLSRLNVDLSGWRGTVIQIRFRLVTASDSNLYFGDHHYEDDPSSTWGGMYIDDVQVYGKSIQEQ